jgi:PIN domain nuclease of toxin-antitoxin system
MVEVATTLLVDTHFILWIRIDPRQLRNAERAALETASTRFVSVVSLWEIAIMISIGRLRRDGKLLETPSGFDLLPVVSEHCQAYAALPMHHRDPFDRMLIAQARSEGVPLLTRDRALAAYGEEATILQLALG